MNIDMFLTILTYSTKVIVTVYGNWYPNGIHAIDISSINIGTYDAMIMSVRFLRVAIDMMHPLLNTLSYVDLTDLRGNLAITLRVITIVTGHLNASLLQGNLEIEPYQIVELYSDGIGVLASKLQFLDGTARAIINRGT